MHTWVYAKCKDGSTGGENQQRAAKCAPPLGRHEAKPRSTNVVCLPCVDEEIWRRVGDDGGPNVTVRYQQSQQATFGVR